MKFIFPKNRFVDYVYIMNSHCLMPDQKAAPYKIMSEFFYYNPQAIDLFKSIINKLVSDLKENDSDTIDIIAKKYDCCDALKRYNNVNKKVLSKELKPIEETSNFIEMEVMNYDLMSQRLKSSAVYIGPRIYQYDLGVGEKIREEYFDYNVRNLHLTNEESLVASLVYELKFNKYGTMNKYIKLDNYANTIMQLYTSNVKEILNPDINAISDILKSKYCYETIRKRIISNMLKESFGKLIVDNIHLFMTDEDFMNTVVSQIQEHPKKYKIEKFPLVLKNMLKLQRKI